jgi:hypothetical protein
MSSANAETTRVRGKVQWRAAADRDMTLIGNQKAHRKSIGSGRYRAVTAMTIVTMPPASWSRSRSTER